MESRLTNIGRNICLLYGSPLIGKSFLCRDFADKKQIDYINLSEIVHRFIISNDLSLNSFLTYIHNLITKKIKNHTILDSIDPFLIKMKIVNRLGYFFHGLSRQISRYAIFFVFSTRDSSHYEISENFLPEEKFGQERLIKLSFTRADNEQILDFYGIIPTQNSENLLDLFKSKIKMGDSNEN